MPIIKREELIEALKIVFEPSGMTKKKLKSWLIMCLVSLVMKRP